MPTNVDTTTPVRDAACLILIDRSEAEARILMGRRLATQVFLPNKWVFPGGRVEDDDRMLAATLTEASSTQRMGNAEHVAFALAAVREALEEAGLCMAGGHISAADALPPAWNSFSRLGRLPDLNRLRPLARAITPPDRPRRFDTWFFIGEWHPESAITATPDGELLDLGWYTLGEIRTLDLPHITRLIVDDVASWLELSPGAETPLIPFYFQDFDGYKRNLINASWPFLAP